MLLSMTTRIRECFHVSPYDNTTGGEGTVGGRERGGGGTAFTIKHTLNICSHSSKLNNTFPLCFGDRVWLILVSAQSQTSTVGLITKAVHRLHAPGALSWGTLYLGYWVKVLVCFSD